MAKIKKYKKQTLKIEPIVFVALAVLVVLVVLGIVLNIPNRATRLANEYQQAATDLGISSQITTTISDTNHYKKVSLDKAISDIQKGQPVLVLIGAKWDVNTVTNIGTIDQYFDAELKIADEKDAPKLSNFIKEIYLVEIAEAEDPENDYYPVRDALNKLSESVDGLEYKKNADKTLLQLLTFNGGKFLGKLADIKGSTFQARIRDLYLTLVNSF